MTSNKYYFVHKGTLQDIGQAIRVKRKLPADTLYNATQFAEEIEKIPFHVDEISGYIPIPEIDLTNVGEYKDIIQKPSSTIYLWNNEPVANPKTGITEDPDCPSVTGGWDLTQTQGLTMAGSTATQETDNRLSMKIPVSGTTFKAGCINTKNSLPVAEWKAAGKNVVVLKCSYYYSSDSASSTALLSKKIPYTISGIWYDSIKAKASTVAGAYNNFQMKNFIKNAIQTPSTMYKKPLPSTISIQLPQNADLNKLSIVLHSNGLSGSTTSSIGARIYIQKIYVI